MKFTLPWLKEHLATEASLGEIVEQLTMLGLEVEAVEKRGADLSPFRVAQVTEVRPHPDAERLSLCRVDTGEHVVEVVCGAPNVHAGMKAVFAPVGAIIPGSGEVLKRARIRGVESNGMLCSARELLLGEDHDGHHRAAGRCPGRAAGERGDHGRGPPDRCRDHPEPQRLLRRPGHRSGAGGGRSRRAEIA